MELPDRTQAKTWEGREVADRDGQPLGRCVGVFADTATGVAEWLHVDVEGHARSFVPALEATEADGTVRVRFSREQVLSAPSVGDDVQLSKAEEIELYRHYDVPVDREGSGSVLPSDAQDAGGSATDDRSALVGAGTAGAGDAADGADPDEQAVLATTGLDLPVLDPAAASTPVPEGGVTYVDEPEDFASGERPAADSAAGAAVAADEPAAAEPATSAPPAAEPAPAAAPSLPPPTLRRVNPSPTPSAAPAPRPQSSGGGASDLSAAAPLGAAAGLAALVALALRARDRRARRRSSPAARADRLRQTLRAGSAAALSSAGSSLAAVPDAAAQTRRQAAEAAAEASRRAARRQAKASASASRAARRRKRQAAASLSAASQAAQRQKRQAAAAMGTASRRRRSTTGTVAAVPTRIARRGRKARKSLARKVWELVLLGTAGGGYVLGAKAGRERYDELSQVAGAVAASPTVQAATEAVTDPQRRADLLGEVQQLVGRRGGHSG